METLKKIWKIVIEYVDKVVNFLKYKWVCFAKGAILVLSATKLFIVSVKRGWIMVGTKMADYIQTA